MTAWGFKYTHDSPYPVRIYFGERGKRLAELEAERAAIEYPDWSPTVVRMKIKMWNEKIFT
jgi:hypothetical protein